MSFTILGGDCREVMADLPAESVHAIVTDPPYGLGEPPDPRQLLTDWLAEARHEPGSKSGFMGHDWDRSVPGPEVWVECLRVLKPGGHLLAFAGSRTVDLMGLAIRLSGFEVRDSLVWLYGQGFPKGQDLGRSVDRHLSAEGITSSTPEGEQWSGWSTQLKPAHEPVIVARKKPDGSIAANLLAHSAGGYNIDACRLPVHPDDPVNTAVWTSQPSAFREGTAGFVTSHEVGDQQVAKPDGGRYPANVLLDEEAAEMLDAQTGERSAGTYEKGARGGANDFQGPASIPVDGLTAAQYDDIGGASRFFYSGKATRAEREAGLPPASEGQVSANFHPTVKPIDVMRWLVKLVTPVGGRILDPFVGSGTTGCAAVLEGFDFVGIEQSVDFQDIARARVAWWEGREGETIEILRAARLVEQVQERHRAAGQLDLNV